MVRRSARATPAAELPPEPSSLPTKSSPVKPTQPLEPTPNQSAPPRFPPPCAYDPANRPYWVEPPDEPRQTPNEPLNQYCETRDLVTAVMYLTALGHSQGHRGYRCGFLDLESGSNTAMPPIEPIDLPPPQTLALVAAAEMQVSKVDVRAQLPKKRGRTPKGFWAKSPGGELFNPSDISLVQFCKLHGLNVQCMCQVARGTAKHHKGWTCGYTDNMAPAVHPKRAKAPQEPVAELWPGLCDYYTASGRSQLDMFQVDVFSSVPFTGSPAAVIMIPVSKQEAEALPASHPLSAPMLTSTMLRLAGERNICETVFVRLLTKADTFVGSDVFELRWFSPAGELSGYCHSTLAAAAVLSDAHHNRSSTIHFETAFGRQASRYQASRADQGGRL